MSKQPITVLDKERLLLRAAIDDLKHLDNTARLFGRDSPQALDALACYHQRIMQLWAIHPYHALQGQQLKTAFFKSLQK